jgi:hypothetical protein
MASLLSGAVGGLWRCAVPLTLEPADDLVLIEEAPTLNLERRKLMRRREAVDLLGLAAEDGGEFVDGEEGR